MTLFSPQGFLFHSRYNFCVDVHVEIKLKAEALLTGVLQGETDTLLSLHRWSCSSAGRIQATAVYVCAQQIHRGAPSHYNARLRQRAPWEIPLPPPQVWGSVQKTYYMLCTAFPCVYIITHISVSSPWFLLHQLQPPCFTLPARQLNMIIHKFFNRSKHQRNCPPDVSVKTLKKEVTTACQETHFMAVNYPPV